ncbi:LXG domain-containing protein [Salicibibacter cibarius]|uniref:LXG domain-containing protein n=2 Tax=Salicibibacter cibarius TaxID=2743000 RepID=A0A7T6Z734_9BACI|nr:LXG domain-containing protein [Salicibibacter cibarius]
MKRLEVAPLKEGIDDVLESIASNRDQLVPIRQAVHQFIGLQGDLKGQGGEAIRSFFADCHEPFLALYDSVLETFEMTLTDIRSRIDGFEPASNGVIDRNYLEHELHSGLQNMANLVEDLTSETNDVLRSVNDIVYLEPLSDAQVMEGIDQGNRHRVETIQQLDAFDAEQTNLLSEVKENMLQMQTYLADISANINDGSLGVVGYQRTQLSDLDAYQALEPAMHQAAAQMPGVSQMHPAHHLQASPFGFAQSPMNAFISDFQPDNQNVQSQMNFNDFYFMNTQMNGHEAPHLNPLLMGSKGNNQAMSQHGLSNDFYRNIGVESSDPTDVFQGEIGGSCIAHDPGHNFFAGEEIEINENWTAPVGAGRYDIEEEYIGGSAEGSAVHAAIEGEYDNTTVDGSYSLANGSAEASVKEVEFLPFDVYAPTARVDGSLVEGSAGTSWDPDFYDGEFGGEAEGQLLQARAFVGVDEDRIGAGAHASLASGELSGSMTIPFTDTDVELTLGGHAGAIGGEAEFGDGGFELSLSKILGFKFGVKFD